MLDHGSGLYSRFFSHELSEAELACLLKVFTITIMLETRAQAPTEQQNKKNKTGDQDKD